MSVPGLLASIDNEALFITKISNEGAEAELFQKWLRG